MFRRTWSGDYVHSWENLGGTLASDPDCVAQKPARIDCFARGEDGAMWHDRFDGDAWSGWVSHGGDLAEETKPACALRSAGKIECLVVWDDKTLRHMSVGSDDWDEVGEVTAALPSTENLVPSPKCYGAPDDARVDCFLPVADDGRRALMYLRYDGSWTLDDLSSDFGREAAGPDRELAQYDFDCVVRTDARFDCMELAAWRGYKGAAAEDGKAVRFRHYAYALGGPPAQWRNVPLTMPVQAGNVSFLKCLSVDGDADGLLYGRELAWEFHAEPGFVRLSGTDRVQADETGALTFQAASPSLRPDYIRTGETLMIKVHHLNNSRSHRVLWLLEELGTPYEIVHYKRDAVTRLAPPELKKVHPLGKSPVISDGDLVVAESGAIIEYLTKTYGKGKFWPADGSPGWIEHSHWMHFAEGSAMLPFLLGLYVGMLGESGALRCGRASRARSRTTSPTWKACWPSMITLPAKRLRRQMCRCRSCLRLRIPAGGLRIFRGWQG